MNSDSEAEIINDDSLACNIVHVFGCPPSRKVSGKSGLLKALKKRFDERASESKDGAFLLPEAIYGLATKDSVETLIGNRQ